MPDGALSDAATGEIRVGLAVPLTGRMASIGLAMRRALEDAVTEANAAGGIGGLAVTLIVEDDACAAAAAEGAARKLVADKVAVVIGHPCSGAAAAAVPAYREADVLAIAVGARHPDVTAAAPAAPILRLAGRDDRQGDAAALWLLARAPNRRIAIVQDRTAYARALAARTAAVLDAAGVGDVPVLPIVAGQRTYADTLRAVRELNAEAVFFAGYPDEAAIIVAGLSESATPIPLLGADALATDAFARIAAQARTPVEVLLPHEVSPRAGVADGARARGAFEAWREMAQGDSTKAGAAMAHALRGVKVDTPSLGPIVFDAQGDLTADAFVPAHARAGQWVAIER